MSHPPTRTLINHNPDLARTIAHLAGWDARAYPSVKSGKVKKHKPDDPNSTTNRAFQPTQTAQTSTTAAPPPTTTSTRTATIQPRSTTSPTDSSKHVAPAVNKAAVASHDAEHSVDYTPPATTPTKHLASIFTTNPYSPATTTTTTSTSTTGKAVQPPPFVQTPPPLTSAAIPSDIRFNPYTPPDYTTTPFTFNTRILYTYLKPQAQRSAHDNACVYYEDQQVVVVYDRYAKSTVHLLIIPKHVIPTINDIKQHHAHITHYIHNIGTAIIAHMQHTQYAKLQFDLGYHWIPSLQPLHCHLISTDYISDALKNKKHWNSFTTPFFVRSTAVCRLLDDGAEAVSALLIDESKAVVYEKQEMVCNRVGCRAVLQNIPTLKAHIKQCKHLLPSGM